MAARASKTDMSTYSEWKDELHCENYTVTALTRKAQRDLAAYAPKLEKYMERLFKEDLVRV